jgi:hypothetical protein
MPILPGDFTQFNFAPYEVTMLVDAYIAISKVPGGWEYLARPTVPAGDSFMFGPETPTMKAINDAMTFTGHSGASYGMTMRAMEFIAKKGWDAYVASCRPLPPPPTAQEFVREMRATPGVLPNQDEQLDTFDAFLSGKMSYAEMRSRIG